MEIYSQLLEEVIELAIEDGAIETCENFTDFVQSMLPENILNGLATIAGGSAFLIEVWEERFMEKESAVAQRIDDSDGDFLSEKACLICERQLRLTKHHLIPQQTHKSLIKKGYSKELLSKTIAICRLCHNTIHRLFTHDELASRSEHCFH
jgi:hypothetical protein